MRALAAALHAVWAQAATVFGRRDARIHARACIAVLAVMWAAGCAGGEEADNGTSFVQRDSAGIHIIETRHPLWGESDGWRLAAEPEWIIGEEGVDATGSEGIALSRVVDIRVMPLGRIVLGNGGWHEILVYDSLGRLRRDFLDVETVRPYRILSH